jgi:hypothetical protein
MQFTTKAQAKKLTGLNYLGSVNMTTKHKKATDYNELTYSLYLAPAKMSGYEVCPKRNKECTSLCLNESGMNTMNMQGDKINKSRIAKTKLFFEEREFFMAWLIDEITTAHIKARTLGYKFSVRLNNTSDISPEMFYIKKGLKSVNILELFPNVQFYDYTKVLSRINLTKKYKNYDLTFSYSGYNIDECKIALENKIRIAIVFKQVPAKFWGLKVINGDAYDMRYHDKKNVIVGLKFKRVRTKLDKKIKFVVQ